MDGNTWTSNKRLAEAIDKSQDNGGAATVLLAEDGENFEQLLGELAGCCTEQALRGPYVVDFSGYEDGSYAWSVQLSLKALSEWRVIATECVVDDFKKALDLLQACTHTNLSYKLSREISDFLKGFR